MIKRRIKVFPITVAFVLSGLGFSYFLDKENSISCKDVMCDDSFIGPICTTTISTTSTTTSTTVTTENIYSDILFLYDGCYSMDEINEMIVKYSSFCNFSYDESVSILGDYYSNYRNYVSLEDYIMCGLFDYGDSMGLLSSSCSNCVKKEMSRDQMESIMIDMCDVMGISNDDKKIILAIFRWETGNGTSSLCVNCNNYGGIKVGNDFGVYETPYYGMYKAIKCIYSHILTSKEKGFSDICGIVSDMSYRYCYDTANDWANSINGMIYSINDYYNFDGMYTKKYEG